MQMVVNVFLGTYIESDSCSVSSDVCTEECFTSSTNDCYSFECNGCGCLGECQTYDYFCNCSEEASTCCFLIWNWLDSCCESDASIVVDPTQTK